MLKHLSGVDKNLYFIELILLLASAAFEIGLAYIMLLCVEIAQSGDLNTALNYIGFFLAYILLSFLFDYASRKLKLHLLRKAKANLRLSLFRKIIHLPNHDYREMNSGEWLSILTNDMDVVEQSYFKESLNIFVNTVELLVSLILISWISPILSVFTLIIAGIQLLIPRYFAPKLSARKKAFLSASEIFTKRVSEELHAYDLINEFHIYASAYKRMEKSNDNVARKQFLSRVMSSTSYLVSFTMGQILYVGIYFIGALLVVMNQLTIPQMIACSQLIVYITSPLIGLSTSLAEFKSAKVVFKRFEEILNSLKNTGQHIKMHGFHSSLQLLDVSYSYPGEKKEIICNSTYEFVKGKKYLLIGESGVGKSTIMKLIKGLVKPNTGTVMIDGEDVSNVCSENLSDIISYNAQSTFVYNATLKENITLFNSTYSDKDIMSAIENAGLMATLNKNNWSLETTLDESGVNLSGGEKQRIALARILLKNTPLILLDESFANIDNQNVIRILDKILCDKSKTLVLISHQSQKSLLHKFDQVLIIKNSRLIPYDSFHKEVSKV